MSVSSSEVGGNHGSFHSVVSADGRFAAFDSEASNLVPGDTNLCADVFVRDRQSGTTQCVSIASGGAPGNGHSINPAMSADGRFVAFSSFASNLIVGGTIGWSDVFVHDRQTATTERVSVATGGAPGNSNSTLPAISTDGRFVAFSSYASDLIGGDTNGVEDVFVHDRQLATTERVSLATGGAAGDGYSSLPSISADGRFVAFVSHSTNLVVGDWNGCQDIFVRDRQSGTTERVSVSTGGTEGDNVSWSAKSALSADGRFVAFYSVSVTLVAGDTNGTGDVFLRDRQNGTTERLSVDSNGAQANHVSWFEAISADGRFVTFHSAASQLVPGDTNAAQDVFVRDLANGTTERVSLATGGAEGSGSSFDASISYDGRFVSYRSDATNLVPGDTNGFSDVFVHDRAAPPPPSPFCFGTDAACPCGSGAGAGNGCPSSVNPGGANLGASGTATTTVDTFVLLGSGMPNSSALYFQGTSQVANGAGVVFGDGLRCVGGSILRLGTQSNQGGASQYPADGDPRISVRGQVTAPGVRTYQVWYRNAAAFCTAATFNLTNGLEVTWTL